LSSAWDTRGTPHPGQLLQYRSLGQSSGSGQSTQSTLLWLSDQPYLAARSL